MQLAVSTPLLEMVPAAGVTVQVKVALLMRLPCASRAWAPKPVTLPAFTVVVAGETMTLATGPTE